VHEKKEDYHLSEGVNFHFELACCNLRLPNLGTSDGFQRDCLIE
jgi:hypothetical protein